MSSRYLACCLAGLLGTGGFSTADPGQDTPPAAQKKDEPAQSLADQIATIKKEHQDRQKKFYADLTTFRNDDKKVSDLNQEYFAATRKQADQLRALIKSHAKEPEAFEGFLVYSGVI